jgi:hypothetical protein
MKDILKHEDYFPNELGILGGSEPPRIFDKCVENDFDKMSNFEHQFYIANGRELPEEKKEYIEVYDYILRSVVYNDIKIWPNRIVAYASASQNSTYAIISAGSVAMDSKIMGYRPIEKAYNTFLYLNTIKEEKSIKELSKYITPYGFGRPQFGKDERVENFKKKYVNEKFLQDFPTVKMAFDLEKELDGNMFLNYGGLGAAFIIDYGVSMEEYKGAHISVFLQVFYGIRNFVTKNTPNYKFLPVRSEKIIYEGDYKIGRKWEDD